MITQDARRAGGRHDDIALGAPAGEQGNALVVLLDARLAPRCLEQLNTIVEDVLGAVVVAVPEALPRWWTHAVSSGLAPMGVSEHLLRDAARSQLHELLALHRQLDGLDVRFLPWPSPAWIDPLIRECRITSVIVVDHVKRSRRSARLLRAVAPRCSARVVVLGRHSRSRRRRPASARSLV